VATPTHIALANVTLSGNDSDVQFSSIPSTYRDLVIVINGQSNSDNRAFYVRFNGAGEDINTSMVYTANATSSTDVGLWVVTDTSKGQHIINVMDYSVTNKHKTVLMRSDRPISSNVHMYAGRWGGTDAVNQINLSRSGYNWTSGATFALYGIVG
jgi:hypothetical protein